MQRIFISMRICLTPACCRNRAGRMVRIEAKDKTKQTNKAIEARKIEKASFGYSSESPQGAPTMKEAESANAVAYAEPKSDASAKALRGSKPSSAPKSNMQEGQIEYIDAIRIFSMLSVVFLHTAAGSLRGNLGSAAWHLSNIFTAVMGTSVPLFFMISGALVLGSSKTLSVEYTYKKRLLKMFVPFLMWSLVAIAFFEAMNLVVAGSIRWDVVMSKLKNAPRQATTVHLWFIYVLIPLYMLSPLLKKLVDGLTRELVRYLLILWVLFSALIPTIVSFLPERLKPLMTLSPAYNLDFMTGYLGYFLAGYYLMTTERRFSKRFLAAVILVDTLVISLGTWALTMGSGEYSELFKVYSHVFTLVMSASAFLLFKELFRDRRLSPKIAELVRFLSSVSFGVYLLHNLVVELVGMKVKLWPAYSLFTLFAAYFIVLFITLLGIVIASSLKPTCFPFTGLTYAGACKTCNIQYFYRKIFKGPSEPPSTISLT